jgi:Amidase
MRRPAAVSGTYGNRPSQGMIVLDRAIPLSYPQDTAGVFSRDPRQWVKFAKAWYSPSLHQDPSINGLSALNVEDTKKYPKRVLYLDEYLPLANSAAQTILEDFLAKMTPIFDMKIAHTNLTAAFNKDTKIFSGETTLTNFGFLTKSTGAFSGWAQGLEVSGPLVRAWATLFDGRYPPVDPAWRQWSANPTPDAAAYAARKQTRAKAVEWFETDILYATNSSCSEAMLICDIGSGGLPSYREKDLNVAPNATLLGVKPAGADITCANICPTFG